MSDDEIPDGRCGYTYDVSTLPGVGGTTCWRQSWEEHDYCVWHTRDESKSREDLATEKPSCPERLDGAYIEHATLDDTDWLTECTLIGAEFVSVDIRGAALDEADLRESHFDDVDGRRADLSQAHLEDAKLYSSDFRDADLEHARFDQTIFESVRINRGTKFGDKVVYDYELDDTEDEELYQKLSQAAVWGYEEIRELHADNALSNEARQYYFREKDVRRRLAWRTGHHLRALKSEASRWTTGYAMNPWRVLGTALVVIVVSALLYPTTGGLVETIEAGGEESSITWSVDNPDTAPIAILLIAFFRSLYFSVVTFTTLGYGDIRPVGDIARTIAGIEAILGQILLAILVFVLQRRIS